MRKGQVTIFVILGLLIVVGGLLVYFFIEKPFSDEKISSSPVQTFVFDCIEKSLEDVVFYVGMGGGYYIPPVERTEDGFSYYFNGESLILPTRDGIEKEIERGLINEIIFCVDGFESFSDYDIETRKVVVDVKVFDESIEADIEFPISIKKGDESVLLKDFGTYSLNVRLGKIHYGVIKMFTEDYYSRLGICLSCLLDFVEENEMEMDVYSEDDDDVFVIKDSFFEKEEDAFKFVFANKRFE